MMNDKELENYLKMNREHTRDPFWVECYEAMNKHFDSDCPAITLQIITREFRNFAKYWELKIEKRDSYRENARLRAKRNYKLKKAIQESPDLNIEQKERLAARV